MDLSSTDTGADEKAGAEGASQKKISGKVVMEVVRQVPQFGDHERDEALSWLAAGRDKLEAHLVLATHHHMRGVRAGTPDYYSIRDNEADDGSYTFRDGPLVGEEAVQEARARCLAQLPLAAQAVHHAVQAVVLAPKESAALFALGRTMEGLIDCGGTILAIAASDEPGRQTAVDAADGE